MPDATLKQKFHTRPMCIGMQSFSASPALVEILGIAGFDWVSIDMEHSPTGLETLEHLARAARSRGLAPLARVPRNDPIEIMRVLDRGVDGVIVPHVKTKADLEAILDAARYHPEGHRGACTSTRASGYGMESWPDYLQGVRDNLVIVAIIEDVEGVQNFDELLTVDGIDAFWLGTRDLTQAMGLPDVDLYDERLADIARGMSERAAAAGKRMMATVGPVLSIEYARYLHSIGFQLISYGTDVKNFGRFARSVIEGLEAE